MEAEALIELKKKKLALACDASPDTGIPSCHPLGGSRRSRGEKRQHRFGCRNI